MVWLKDFLHMFAMGVPGWLLLRFLHVPSAGMVGSMLSAGFFAVSGWSVPAVPAGANLVLQVVLGLFIGVRVTREAGAEFRRSAPIALMAAAWWLIFPMVLGALVTRWFGLDLPTSLLGTVPGGIAEMSLLALTLEANAALVALMQFFRLASVLVGMPFLSAWINRRMGGIPGPEKTCRPTAEGPAGQGFRETASAVGLAVLGGIAGSWARLPAGAFVGAMAFTGIASALGLRLQPLPVAFRTAAQVGLGALIGLNTNPEVVAILKAMLLPTVAVTAAMVAWGILLGFMVRRGTNWNLMTCLLATCPGGITQLSSIAEELGADPLRVSLLHLVRLFTIFLVLPPIITWILR